MLIDFRTKDTKRALPLAILLVGLALVLVSFISFKKADPPIGTETVALSLADFGNYEEGSGDVDQTSDQPTETEDTPTETSENVEEVQTQAPDPIVTQTESTVQTQTSETQSSDNAQTQETQQQVSNQLQNAFDQIGSSSSSQSDGDSDGGGDEGSPDGHIEGKGIFGNGNGWELGGRGMLGKPIVSEEPMEAGKVVVDIYVDRQGKVVSASVNNFKSNTTSAHLRKLALDAAKKATFTVKADAPQKQPGTITFNFNLK